MDDRLYEMILKRKSFHLFRDLGDVSLTEADLSDILNVYDTLTPLYPEIRTMIRIVPAEDTSCNRGEEYCILFYSEKKDGYLQNIGYLGEQLDLYLVSKDIANLWFGIGKVEEKTYDGMDYVIMIAISKTSPDKFRKDMFKSKRKHLDEIWEGPVIEGVSDIVRFAPSACNSQPWLVRNEGELSVFRYKKPGKRGIMPVDKVSYYNRIDIGIFLCFLDILLSHKGIAYKRELFNDDGEDREFTLNARYVLNT
ncbi:MAG: nitroreductase [Erysipelotrichaceae bacterium]|nr:nitroreductase [Erysipelotrichaceae bacterium]MBQ6126041.1 nitroreductase [Erysipelotrichaceae bacterium]